jgi:hypothetical protein
VLQNWWGESYNGNMSISAGITAVKASLDLAKVLSDRLSRPELDVGDVRAKVHEMLIHMVNAQLALGDAQVEISDLRRELDNRAELRALDADVEFRVDGGFFVRKSEAQTGLIAYCPLCWKSDGKIIPLKASTGELAGCFSCSIHKTEYKTAQGEKNAERFWRNINASPRGGGWDSH